MSTNGTITLSVDGSNRSATLPVLGGTAGPQVIDIRKLYGALGMFTFDPGYGETASCESKITYIDGDAGLLMYRGYPIEQLAEKSDFIEVCYLLMNGELPNGPQLDEFRKGVIYHTMVHEQIRRFFDGFRRDAHPMAVMCGVVGALAAFYHDNIDINDPRAREIAAFRLIAKVPTIAAMAYKYALGQPFVYPKNVLTNGPQGYARNFIHMLKSVPAEEYDVPDVLAKAMDRILILHADHEQNASTSTVRLAGSTGANPFACIAAGIAALWGPAHGGANEAVLKMLAEIGHPKNIPAFISEVKDKESHTKLMGFGHRVYKNFDPRAKIMKDSCDEVLAALGVAHEPLLDIARELERIALTDDYFISRRLYPNVDFYSGIILKAMEIPTSMFTAIFAVNMEVGISMFTAIFAVARTIGWVSQWKEMVEEPGQRIGRPRQLYTGAAKRDYTPIGAR